MPNNENLFFFKSFIKTTEQIVFIVLVLWFHVVVILFLFYDVTKVLYISYTPNKAAVSVYPPSLYDFM